jgi:hypothetical protein
MEFDVAAGESDAAGKITAEKKLETLEQIAEVVRLLDGQIDAVAQASRDADEKLRQDLSDEASKLRGEMVRPRQEAASR